MGNRANFNKPALRESFRIGNLKTAFIGFCIYFAPINALAKQPYLDELGIKSEAISGYRLVNDGNRSRKLIFGIRTPDIHNSGSFMYVEGRRAGAREAKPSKIFDLLGAGSFYITTMTIQPRHLHYFAVSLTEKQLEAYPEFRKYREGDPKDWRQKRGNTLNWLEAQKYLNFFGLRLPTAAEWLRVAQISLDNTYLFRQVKNQEWISTPGLNARNYVALDFNQAKIALVDLLEKGSLSEIRLPEINEGRDLVFRCVLETNNIREYVKRWERFQIAYIENRKKLLAERAPNRRQEQLNSLPEDIRQLVDASFPDNVLAFQLRAHSFDLGGDQRPEHVVYGSYEENGKYETAFLLFGYMKEKMKIIWEERSTTGRTSSYMGTRFFGRQGKVPSFMGYQEWCGASMRSCSWKFFAMKEGSLVNVLSVGSGGELKQIDLDKDGQDELLFRYNNDVYNRRDEIFVWDPDLYEFSPDSNFPSYWQGRIVAVLPKYRAMVHPDRSLLPLSGRLANWYETRGGDEGIQEYLKLVEKKLQPFIDDYKFDHIQKRARKILADVQKRLGA